MKKVSYNFVSVGFAHKTRRASALFSGKYFGEPVTKQNGEKVKTFAATSIFEDIAINDDSCFYVQRNLNGDVTAVYGEITANGVLHHFLVDENLDIKMSESEFAGRYHIFTVLLARHIVKQDTVAELFEKAYGYFASNGPTDTLRDMVLDFTNAMWYQRLDDDFEIAHDSLSESDIKAFFNTGFDEQYGNVFSEYEEEAGKQAAPTKKATKSVPGVQSDEDMWKDICDGKHIIPFDWDEEVKGLIWPLSFLKKAKMPNHQWFTIYRYIRGNILHALERTKNGDLTADSADVVNVNLMSIPGTGKTFGVYLMAAALGYPVGMQNVSDSTDEDQFLVETEIDGGQVKKVMSLSALTHKYGGFCFHEEINLAKKGRTKGALGQRTEFPYVAIITVDGKKVYIHRHALCVYICTMNTDENGVDFDPATATRYAYNPVMKNPDDEDFIERLAVDGAPRERAEWVKKLWDKVQDMLRINDAIDVADRVSFRHAKTALQAMNYNSPQEAIENTFYGAMYQVNPEIADTVWQALQSDTVFCNPPA